MHSPAYGKGVQSTCCETVNSSLQFNYKMLNFLLARWDADTDLVFQILPSWKEGEDDLGDTETEV